MKKVIRLNESDLTQLIKRVILEKQAIGVATSNLTKAVTGKKITATASSLLDNDSETFNTSIGVKQLPACFSYATDLQKIGVQPKEVGDIVDLLDWPMDQTDANRAKQWSEGNGIPGSFGGSYTEYGPLKDRYLQKGGLYYPAVEDLRVEYNLDEYFETLGGRSQDSYLVGFRKRLIEAYQRWIDCVNGKVTK